MDDGSGVATSPDDFIFGTSDMAETPICDMSASSRIAGRSNHGFNSGEFLCDSSMRFRDGWSMGVGI